MPKEKFADGSEITFDAEGRVRAVTFSPDTESIFSEHRSLFQLAQDLQHHQLRLKHAPPKPAAPPAEEAKTPAAK